MRKADVRRSHGSQYLAEWKMKSESGKPIDVEFKFKADRRTNMLNTGLLSGFDLPKQPFSTIAPKQLAMQTRK